MKAFPMILVFILLCRLGFSQGSDHLVPVEGYFDAFMKDKASHSYHERTRKQLFKGLEKGQYIVRIVILPSFQPEKLLSIEYQDGNLILLRRAVELPRWGPGTPHTSPPTQELKFEDQKVKVSEELAQELKELFLVALYQVKYPKTPRTGLDGTLYYFITHKQWAGTMAGKTWSPEEGTKMYELVELTAFMEKLLQSQAPEEDQESMIVTIKALKKKLQED